MEYTSILHSLSSQSLSIHREFLPWHYGLLDFKQLMQLYVEKQVI